MENLTNKEIQHVSNYLIRNGYDISSLQKKLGVSEKVAKGVLQCRTCSDKTVGLILDNFEEDCETLFGNDIPYFTIGLDDIGRKIKQARIDAGLSREDLANAISMNASTIVGWENYRRETGRFVLDNIAEATYLTPHELFSNPLVDLKNGANYIKVVRNALRIGRGQMINIMNGAHYSKVREWEKGIHRPRLETIKNLVDPIGLTLDEFAGMSMEEISEYCKTVKI